MANAVYGSMAPIALALSQILKDLGNEWMSILLLVHGNALLVCLVLGLIEDFMGKKK